MPRIRTANTKPEMIVLRLVHALGYRYRLHAKGLPGNPDLVFWNRKKVIFVHGCFWHQHPDADCPLVRVPKSSVEYWQPKLARNSARDSLNLQRLKDLGWDALIIWECWLKWRDDLRETLKRFLGAD
jgi:DNA mismatch endonuclease (patch repair protein)